MSGINPGFSTKNTLDAGASSAIKSTDLTDGIHEDASSDIKSKQQGTIFGGGNPLQGGLLDQVGGSSGAVGFDAKHGSSVTATTEHKAGAAYDDAKKGTQNAAESASQGLSGLGATIGQYAESAKNEASKVGAQAESAAQDATQSARGTAGNLGENVSNAANDANTGAHSGGGVLDALKDKVSGVFGTQPSLQTQQESAFAAGASSATKNTDLTDGIHEDAGKGIESVLGATGRKS